MSPTEGVVPSMRLDRRLADFERGLSVEHPECLVLVVMDVQGASAPGGSVTSTTVICPPVSAAVALMTASPPPHQRAPLVAGDERGLQQRPLRRFVLLREWAGLH